MTSLNFEIHPGTKVKPSIFSNSKNEKKPFDSIDQRCISTVPVQCVHNTCIRRGNKEFLALEATLFVENIA